ncbi:MAG: DUF4388 domain-containing protein [Planctomycetota bacterium]
MATPSDAGEKGKRVMAGHLEEVDIFSVAQFLMLQSKTGTLEMKSNGKNGALYFAGGQVIDARDDAGGDPVEIAFRLFQWKSGGFDFYATPAAVEKKIEKDTQTLLFELAVRMDEESAKAAEQTPVPGQVAAAPGKPQPVKAKAVKPGKAVARLVHKPKGAAVAAVAGGPDMTETQFMQAVQDRLTVFVDELPDTTGREWRQERAAAGTQEAPSRRTGIALSVVSIGVLIILIIFVLKTREADTPGPGGGPGGQPPTDDPVVTLPPSYTFVTAPFTPEREAEDAVRKIEFKCTPNKVDVIGDKLETAVVVLRVEAAWDTDQLKQDATHDAANVINEIFNSPNCQTVQGIDLRVQSHLGVGDELKKWSDVLVVDAKRALHKPVRIRDIEEAKRYLALFSPQFNLN